MHHRGPEQVTETSETEDGETGEDLAEGGEPEGDTVVK
jgi:hypothetical protein